ncbi:MAG: hypothetical protein ACREUU_02520, partial [Gammaproteobacteria bacterium]
MSPTGTGFPSATARVFPISAGSSGFVAIVGAGIGQVPDSGFTITGTGVRLTTASSRGVTSSGTPYVIFPIAADATAEPGLRTIVARSGGDVILYSGGIRVRPIEHNYLPALLSGPVPGFGETIRTGLAFFNDGDRTSQLSYAARGRDGSLLGGSGVVNPNVTSLVASAQRPILDSELFGLDPRVSTEAWVDLSSTEPGAGLFLVFDSAFSRLTDGIGLVRAAARELILPFGAPDERTMYTVANTSDAAASVTLEFVLDSGAVAVTEERTLAPRGQMSFGWRPSERGYVRVISSAPLVAMELFGT